MLTHFTEIYFVLAVASFALNTFPVPEDKYAKWGLGVAQFVVLNWTKGIEHFKQAAEPKP